MTLRGRYAAIERSLTTESSWPRPRSSSSGLTWALAPSACTRADVLQRDGIVWFDADGYKGGPRAAALAALKLRLADERTN